MLCGVLGTLSILAAGCATDTDTGATAGPTAGTSPHAPADLATEPTEASKPTKTRPRGTRSKAHQPSSPASSPPIAVDRPPEGSSSAQQAPRRVELRLRPLIRELPVAGEQRSGYTRSAFTHWVDADGDGCDTRDEVLLQEARRKPSIGSSCALSGGRWVSYYDGTWTADPSTFDIDHLVPLAEAWDSGAGRWSDDTRRRFANDLGDRRSLVAVSASSNRSKSDRDPAEWLPPRNQCRYVRDYAAVKTRWRLAVDAQEKQALLGRAAGCRNVVVVVDTAAVQRGAQDRGGGETGEDNSGGGNKEDNAGTDPRFAYCYLAQDRGYGPYQQGRDPEYAWYTDTDQDGIVCE